jgi:hypothetical protein
VWDGNAHPQRTWARELLCPEARRGAQPGVRGTPLPEARRVAPARSGRRDSPKQAPCAPSEQIPAIRALNRRTKCGLGQQAGTSARPDLSQVPTTCPTSRRGVRGPHNHTGHRDVRPPQGVPGPHSPTPPAPRRPAGWPVAGCSAAGGLQSRQPTDKAPVVGQVAVMLADRAAGRAGCQLTKTAVGFARGPWGS